MHDKIILKQQLSMFSVLRSYFEYKRMKSDLEKQKEFYRKLPPTDFNLADAVKTDVTYQHFSHPEDDGRKLTESNVAEENLVKTIPTVLFIHEWTMSQRTPWYKPLKDGYLKLAHNNVIYVDWSIAGNKSYDVSSANTKPVGKFIAQFLLTSGIPPDNIHIIGHSMGSQVAGFVGKYYLELSGKRIGRITGLDPAGPKFGNLSAELRLCDNDADLVDVVHTDIQLYGYAALIGHVDFYPNEGKHQNGCPPKEEDVNCSHARSTEYFIESLSTRKIAKEACYKEQDYEVTIKVKKNPKEVIFGHHVDKSARGVFYFETNSESPYLK